MTQIVTVSASTAAYATEPLRANARISGVSPVEAATRALSQDRKTTVEAKDGPAAPVMSSAMTAFFLGAGQKRRQNMMTREQVEEEYRYNDGSDTGAVMAARAVERRDKGDDTGSGR